MQSADKVQVHTSKGVAWYHLSQTPESVIEERLAELEPIHQALQQRSFTTRVGQALEIAVYRALLKQDVMRFFGHFRDLNEHGDDQLYSKEEPPSSISGQEIKGKLDFIVVHSPGLMGGVEVKNIREWLYPDREELTDVLDKCCALDTVPVFIGRRIPYVTFSVFNPCGVLIHQTYNQRYPAADSALAEKAKHKDLLGYHDIRLGNEPDKRLLKFIQKDLPGLLPEARDRFERFKDLLWDYATGEEPYKSFAARVKRRLRGEPEDLPVFDEEYFEEDYEEGEDY